MRPRLRPPKRGNDPALAAFSRDFSAAGHKAGIFAMTPLIFLAALAASTAAMPTTDLQKICQNARAAAASEDQKTAYDACVRDEQAARDQLRKNWDHFPANARATCTGPEAVSPSYVEVLTCLEMQSGADFSGGTPKSSITPLTPVEPAAPAAAGKKP
jgi:hypothetical protein